MKNAVKQFDVQEESLPNAWYRITVKRAGEIIERFEKPTMQETKDAFLNAGYIPTSGVLSRYA